MANAVNDNGREDTYDYCVVMDTVHHGPKVVAKCAAGGDAALIAKLLAQHVGEKEVVTSYRAMAPSGGSLEEFAKYDCAHSASNPSSVTARSL